MDRAFKYETPLWGARLICLIYLCVSMLFFSAFYHYESWSDNSPVFFKYFFVFLSMVFLFVSLKPSNRMGWVYFSANDMGLYFPLSALYNESSKDLHIPWNKVGNIKSEMLYGNTKGISLEVLLSDDDISFYFEAHSRVNKILGFNCKRNGFYVIGYASNLFQGTEKVALTLNQLKSKNV
ncbi:MAG: hypothetical protein KUG72_09455 [Pseudomonadales bacterium]|nr:hypothetical protein [Pseudomonadales bacterium]